MGRPPFRRASAIGQVPEQIGVIGPAAERGEVGVGEQVGDVAVALGDRLPERLRRLGRRWRRRTGCSARQTRGRRRRVAESAGSRHQVVGQRAGLADGVGGPAETDQAVSTAGAKFQSGGPVVESKGRVEIGKCLGESFHLCEIIRPAPVGGSQVQPGGNEPRLAGDDLGEPIDRLRVPGQGAREISGVAQDVAEVVAPTAAEFDSILRYPREVGDQLLIDRYGGPAFDLSRRRLPLIERTRGSG